ncbi:hypothetical protein V6N13_066638 [Hibiscus sabdariffa]|uniref:LRAT domain-containing protein n=1 Tax=Hibiscus sabdariffa TaxID=183260 RepID=A0ABR2DR20_9ROSI
MSRTLEPGDHIYCKRVEGLYDHHGENLKVYDYGVSFWEFTFRRSGTCSTRRSKPPYEVIWIATAFLRGEISASEYNFLFNNCEDFAITCKTGNRGSVQVLSYLTAGAVCSAAAIVCPVTGLALAGHYVASKFLRR